MDEDLERLSPNQALAGVEAMILWRRLDVPGHDTARLQPVADGWRIDGAAVFLEGSAASRLDYAITCDASWRTTSAQVTGWIGAVVVAIDIRADGDRHWTLNGQPVPAVAGCDDVDLSFTPATNLLPVRRLALAPGTQAPVHTAWLRTPELTLEPLDQIYERLTGERFRYGSGGGAFSADLDVRPDGFVTRYGGLWVAEPAP